jgi:hypothetical protein
MNDLPVNGVDPEVQAGRKRQVWIVLLVMLVSGCVGVAIIIALIWLFRSFLIPGG